MLTRQEVSNWKIDPVTREFRKRVLIYIEEIKSRWATGGYETYAKAERARGIIEGLTFLNDFEGDDEQKK